MVSQFPQYVTLILTEDKAVLQSFHIFHQYFHTIRFPWNRIAPQYEYSNMIVGSFHCFSFEYSPKLRPQHRFSPINNITSITHTRGLLLSYTSLSVHTVTYYSTVPHVNMTHITLCLFIRVPVCAYFVSKTRCRPHWKNCFCSSRVLLGNYVRVGWVRLIVCLIQEFYVYVSLGFINFSYIVHFPGKC